MRGQVFTMDLFAAYAVFLIILLMVSAMSFWVSSSIEAKEQTDAMAARAIATLDYLCYSEKYADAPYLLKADAIDSFFAQGEEGIEAELSPGWEYFLEMSRLNGTVIHSGGGKSHGARSVVSYARMANYRGETVRMTMGVWRER